MRRISHELLRLLTLSIFHCNQKTFTAKYFFAVTNLLRVLGNYSDQNATILSKFFLFGNPFEILWATANDIAVVKKRGSYFLRQLVLLLLLPLLFTARNILLFTTTSITVLTTAPTPIVTVTGAATSCSLADMVL